MEKKDFLQLLAKRFSGEITPAESRLLQQAIKDNSLYKEEYLHLDKFFRLNQDFQINTAKKLEEVWAAIEKSGDNYKVLDTDETTVTSTSPYHIPFYKKLLRVAAIFVLIAGITAIGYYTFYQKKAETRFAGLELETVNNNDFRSFIKLPDGTTVWLNKGSRIRYNKSFGQEKREVELSGEAFFDVAHNQAVPMTVHAGPIDVLVKGTAFNIKAYPGDKEVETSLVRGLIELTDHAANGRKVLLYPNEKITFPVNHPSVENNMADDKNILKDTNTSQVVYKVEELKAEPKTKVAPELLWMQEEMVFNSEPLGDVLDKLGKRYNVVFEIQEQELKHTTFTGFFKNENLEQALEALRISSGVKYEMNDQKIIIYQP